MSEWLPIESAPKDGTRFLGESAKGHVDIYSWEPMQYHTRKDPYWSIGWASVHWSRSRQPVRWMPLPGSSKGASE